ncbi:hypothetical protein DRP07_03095 [Archaeoglobales archaeon]|nr:MAG: hypothetical protein DRP07_03095 [Archaeoglobales archaeon]
MKKAVIFGLAFAAIVYIALLSYVLIISMPSKEESKEKWIETEKEKEISFAGMDVCRECHFETYKVLMSGNHSTVSCEACHWVGKEHVIKKDAESVKIKRNESWDLCLKCHLKTPANKIKTIIPSEHAKGLYCVVCHEPHK